ncbi:MAG: RNA-guided pseudouridylation complex pseudouridine synthase subunit Cbf5 [Nanoarchaeota archaeon]
MIDLEKIKQTAPIQGLLQFSILNIDKPAGMTSFDVDTKIKNIIGVNKTSHFGTLDPAVTGVLPIALGRACRLMEFFIHKRKTYIGEMHLHRDVEKEKLLSEVRKFIGVIRQLPPVKSSVKREEREREIYRWDIQKINGDDVEFEVECEAGTYIRKLVSDLGERIGGAHMTRLRRIKAGIFEEKDMCSVEELENAVKELKRGNEKLLREMLIPGEIVCAILPNLEIKKEYSSLILTGKPLTKEMIFGNADLKNCGNFCVIHKDKLLAIMQKTSEKNVFGRPVFVLN